MDCRDEKSKRSRLFVYLILLGAALFVASLLLMLMQSPPISRFWAILGFVLCYMPISETFQNWVRRAD
jgi:hypothetical protein